MNSRIRGPRNIAFIRAIATAATLSAMLAATMPASGEDVLVVDPASRSPSSPQQWKFDGTVVVPGAGGQEIVLEPGPSGAGSDSDLFVSFDGESPVDDTGHWTVETVGPYVRSDDSRFGTGAGTFRAPATRLVLKPGPEALFAPDMPLGDLTLELWLKPARADSGEIVFLWKAKRRAGSAWLSQQISCIILRNRMNFGFLNFFAAPAGKPTTFNLQGISVLVPGAWSHHLLRFDSATGLVEYLMNGKTEAIAWATSTGKQSGDVYDPISGGSGWLEMAQNYSGLIDEFSLRGTFVTDPVLRRYPSTGGTATSPIFDLGSTNSTILSIQPQVRLPGESAVHWSYRTGDSSVGWHDEAPGWIPFAPTAPLGTTGSPPKGRYVQVRMALYPDARGEGSPVVSSVRIVHEPDASPTPPGSISAAAGDGRLTIRWSRVSESDIKGYMVYYGRSSGDYFGTGAQEGPSPVRVIGQDSTGITLHGLRNGELYFIAVAAYDDANPPHIGEFSRELTARPSRVSP
ncbi:MAG: hypothetical protein CVV51_09430 [Spirochaetae bacterium HGW-Spirochaetae-7]|jgi:hypothetical protein|nr:MAG: hypothetical protein CVV51_09430 [Spirochaetae bacterium HGW-Spirochaetae-7]